MTLIPHPDRTVISLCAFCDEKYEIEYTERQRCRAGKNGKNKGKKQAEKIQGADYTVTKLT